MKLIAVGVVAGLIGAVAGVTIVNKIQELRSAAAAFWRLPHEGWEDDAVVYERM